MAYKSKEALNTLFGYLDLNPDEVEVVNDIDRAFIYKKSGIEKCVIFVYPISHKKDNKKNFIDTRDSGVRERGLVWEYALENKIKYFCLAVNDEVEKYKDYIFSLECNEKIIREISGNGERGRAKSGTQVVIPNDYVPQKDFERILTKNNLFISVIHKNNIIDYIEKYDNRPYLLDNQINELNNEDSSNIESNRYYSDINCNKLDRNIQNLYFGAPGTGKSYQVTKFIEKVYADIKERDNPFVFKTTIYPDYSYYDFIGNIIPGTKDDGIIEYKFQEGIFSQALARAFEYQDKDVFLVIEEMSRGNVASIFGDIFQLLDRNIEGISEYSINNDLVSKSLEEKGINIEKIYLPSNFHILGTVNTSDQNVHVMDTAFKRRFDFIYSSVDPLKDDNDKFMNSYLFKLENREFEWNKFYMALNEFIITELNLSEDKQIGQFFIKFENFEGMNNADELRFEAIQNKLLHYLWEDVMNASFSEDISIFSTEYNTFSKLYKAFENKKNIFSKAFLDVYDKLSINW